jgi:hypothetical protein
MSSSGVNYWAVLVGGGVYFLLGAIWYSKGLFGKVWMQGIGKTEVQIKAAFSPWKIVWALIGSLIAAYGIARALSWTSAITPAGGIMMGFLAGVCFILAPMTINDVMESRPMKLTAINVLYHMVGFLLIGFIIGAWR